MACTYKTLAWLQKLKKIVDYIPVCRLNDEKYDIRFVSAWHWWCWWVRRITRCSSNAAIAWSCLRGSVLKKVTAKVRSGFLWVFCGIMTPRAAFFIRVTQGTAHARISVICVYILEEICNNFVRYS